MISARSFPAEVAQRAVPTRRRAARRVLTLQARAAATTGKEQPHVAVIGAGWGGWGAAKALAEAGVRVTLLDAARDPTGNTPFKTPTGKPFEAGTRGFWKDYPNLYDLVSELGLSEPDVFTKYTTSAFYSPEGLEATAPVFADSPIQLPSPMGQVLASMDNFKRIPVTDRATMAGILLAILDFEKDDATFRDYDRMTGHELCIRAGLSKRLVDDFVRPTLAVGLFAPLEQTSAAVMLELLYFYALAHQDSFDVRWIAKKSIAELIVAPLAARLSERHGVDIRGSCRVEGLEIENGRVTAVKFTERAGSPQAQQRTLDDVDGVVVAVGTKGMRAIVSGSPALARAAPELASAAALGSIDVISTRLWLDRVVPAPHPANVFSRYEELRGAGGTFFMLDQMQCRGSPEEREAGMRELWGLEGTSGAAAEGGASSFSLPAPEGPLGSVVAADFYFSGALALMPDDALVSLLIDRLLPSAVPEFAGAKVLDSFVLRCPGAVSWFSPGSFQSRPPLQTTIPNLVCAGAKGLCQERAYVSGIEAGNALVRSGTLQPASSFAALGPEHPVLPIRADEPQVVAGKQAAKALAPLLSFMRRS